MLVSAGFCPHPPLLVPEIASGAAAELDPLRAACEAAVTALAEARPGLVMVLGGGPTAARWSDGDGGTLRAFGVEVTVPLAGPVQPGRDRMPLAVTLGAWLLAQAGHVGERVAFSVPESADDEALANWAEQIRDLDDRLALLVMGDGSARRSERSPGYVDPRATPFDRVVATALGAGDPAALRATDPGLGATLLAAGTPAWRLAGWVAGDGRYDAELRYDDAPYGVGYLVASWWNAAARR